MKKLTVVSIISALCILLLLSFLISGCGSGTGGVDVSALKNAQMANSIAKPKPPAGSVSNITGIKPFWTYDVNSIGGGGKAMVNLWNGNLVVQYTDVSFPGRGLPVEIRRTYNAESKYEGTFGRGWTSILDTHLEFQAGKVILMDAYGGTYEFTDPQPVGEAFEYKPPPGRNTVFIRESGGNYIERKKNGTTYVFNSIGNLVSIRHRNVNNFLDMLYDGSGNIIAILEASGRTTFLDYNRGGHIAQITDPEGRKVQYSYKGSQLFLIKDPMGHTTELTYKGRKLAKIKNPRGLISEIDYDRQDRVISYIDPLYRVDYRYDIDNTVVSDTYGHSLTYYLNQSGNNIHTIDTMGFHTYFDWDANMNITHVRDAKEQDTYYTYNGMGDLLTVSNPFYTVNYEYDDNHNLVRSIDGKGLATNFEYITTDQDPYGILNTVNTPMWRTVRFNYNDYGQPIEVINARGFATQYFYDINGNITAVIDARNNTTAIYYNNVGEATIVDVPVNGQTHFVYDSNGLVTSVTTPSGATTSYGYDPNGNRIYMTNPLNIATSYAFDEDDRMIQVTDGLMNVTTYTYQNGLLKTTQDPMGFTTTMDYDANDRMISRSSPITTEAFSYDPLGNITAKRTGLGDIHYAYDELNRLIQTNMPGRMVTYGYDNNGNRLSSNVTDGGGAWHVSDLSVSYSYDNDNRLISKTKSIAGTTFESTVYDYDENSNLRHFEMGIRNGIPPTPARLNPGTGWIGFTYEYDELDRQISVVNFNNDVFRADYDAVGNMTTIYYPDGTTSERSFDNENRITQVINDHPIDNPPHIVYTYSYDAMGNFLTVKCSPPDVVPKNYHYDELNRLIEDESIRRKFVYDSAGNKTKDILTDTGLEIYYTTNGAHQMVNQFPSIGLSGYSFQYAYDQNGNLNQKDIFLTLTRELKYQVLSEYNTVNRLYSKKLYDKISSGYVLLHDVRYSYDADDELFFEEQHGDIDPQAAAATGSRLASWSLPQRFSPEQTLHSEKRTSSVSPRAVGDFHYGFLNFFHGYESGALIYKNMSTGLVYNGQVQEWSLGHAIEYYTYLNGLKVGVKSPGPGGNYFFVYDGQGNVAQASNRAGSMPYALYKYMSYGALFSMEGEAGTGLASYKGYDSGAFGYKLGVRQYEYEGTGRFQSPDPFKGYLSDPQSQNPYMYCRGNPIKYSDPSGYFWDYVTDAAGIANDIYEISKDPYNRWNYLQLGADVILGIIPGVPNTGSVKLGAKGIEKTGELIKAAKAPKAIEKAVEKHHLLPKQFAKKFKAKGLEIEDYTIELEKSAHRLKPGGIHTGKGAENWNGAWKKFFDENPGAEKEQMLNQLDKMKKDFGIISE